MKNLTLDNQVVDQAIKPLSRSRISKVLVRRLVAGVVLLTCIASLLVRPDLLAVYLAGAGLLAVAYLAKILFDILQMDFNTNGIDISMSDIIDDLGR